MPGYRSNLPLSTGRWAKPVSTSQPASIWFDYTNQAWVKAGVYIACGHREQPACGCYGSIHAGETPSPEVTR